MTRSMVRLLRPHQYTKNLLLFAAPGAAGRLDEAGALTRTLIAFGLFCAISSAGYIVNDLNDAHVDRLHPEKRHRPIASGAVTVPHSRAILAALLLVTAVVSPFLGGWFVAAIATYAVVSFGYSFALKQIPWLELVTVSSGFLIRAAAGGAAVDVGLSAWFLIVVSAGALVVIAGKRLGELLTLGADSPSRPVLRHYSATALKRLSGASALVAIAAYAIWAATDAEERAGGGPDDVFLRLTILPFVAALARYLDLSWRGRGEAPDIVVFRDPWMLAAGAAWVLLYSIGLYR